MKRLLLILGVLACSSAAYGCRFTSKPVALQRWYRAEGWALPGLEDVRATAPLTYSSLAPDLYLRWLLVPRDYIAWFPKQRFELEGQKRELDAAPMEIARDTIWEWSIGNRVFAYTYSLTDISAHKKRGKWVVTAVMGCESDFTFIDTDGDGKFDTMVNARLTPDLIPAWAARPKS